MGRLFQTLLSGNAPRIHGPTVKIHVHHDLAQCILAQVLSPSMLQKRTTKRSEDEYQYVERTSLPLLIS